MSSLLFDSFRSSLSEKLLQRFPEYQLQFGKDCLRLTNWPKAIKLEFMDESVHLTIIQYSSSFNVHIISLSDCDFIDRVVHLIGKFDE